jgi:flagellar basal body-associated protein FliL
MAKKVKLDVLDIAIDEEIEQTEPEENRTEGSVLSGIKALIRRPSVWIVSAAVVLLGSLAIVSMLFYGHPAAPLSSVKGKPVASGVVAGDKMALFSGIVVDMKDAKNNMSVAFCDIALEPENSRDMNRVRNNAGARALIYEFLRKRKVEQLLAAGYRSDLKTELKKELNGLFGGEVIKTVYFSHLEVM